MTRCHEIRPYLEAFVDDERSTDNALRVEEHLGSCSTCGEEVRLTRALKRSLRDTILEEDRPTLAFRTRLAEVLAEEVAREEQRAPVAIPWRKRVTPVAFAAAAVAVLSLSNGEWSKLSGWSTSLSLLSGEAASRSHDDESAPTHQGASVVANPQKIIDQLVQYHQAATEPEVTDRSALLRFEPQVGVPMRIPELQQYGARSLGASVVPVERHRAASLRYNLGEHRVTVYLFNPQVVPVRSLQELQLRVIGDRAVFVGMRNGYSIAAIEQRGVGYMIATDLDDRESAELLASIR